MTPEQRQADLDYEELTVIAEDDRDRARVWPLVACVVLFLALLALTTIREYRMIPHIIPVPRFQQYEYYPPELPEDSRNL